MKKITGSIIAVLICFVLVGEAKATQYTHYRRLTTTLPTSTVLAISAAQFNWIDDPNNSNPNAFVPDESTWTDLGSGATVNMAFGGLTRNASGFWTTIRGFAIDVANNGNTGAPQVQFAYTEGSNPNGAGHGLGYKVVLGFNKLVYVSEADPGHHYLIYKKALRDSNVTIAPATIAGGWLRVYMGVYVTPVNNDPGYVVTNAEPFTASDTPGTYTGTLVVTATHT